MFYIWQVKNNATVDGIQYYITDDFGAGLYDSCKDVKFGSSNSRALDFLGAGAKNFKGRCFICLKSQLSRLVQLSLLILSWNN